MDLREKLKEKKYDVDMVTSLWRGNDKIMEVPGGIPTAHMRQLNKRKGFVLITRPVKGE